MILLANPSEVIFRPGGGDGN